MTDSDPGAVDQNIALIWRLCKQLQQKKFNSCFFIQRVTFITRTAGSDVNKDFTPMQTRTRTRTSLSRTRIWAQRQDKDKDLSKCGHISVNIPGIQINAENLKMEVNLKRGKMGTYHRQLRPMSSN